MDDNYALELRERMERLYKELGIYIREPSECNIVALFVDARGFSKYSTQANVSAYDIGHYLGQLQLGLSAWFTFDRLPYKMKLPNGVVAKQITNSVGYPIWSDPIQIKFMGDGAMLLWEYENQSRCISLMANIILRCWIAIGSQYRECSKLPFHPPSGLVFGLAHGRAARFYNTIVATERDDQKCEYAGVCINVASRLSDCSEESALCADATGLAYESYKCIESQLPGKPESLIRPLKGIGNWECHRWILPPIPWFYSGQ